MPKDYTPRRDERIKARTERNAEVVLGHLDGQSDAAVAAGVGLTTRHVRDILKSASVVQLIGEAFTEAGVTPDLIANRIFQALNAERETVVALGNGEFHVQRSPDHNVRLQAAKLALEQGGKWADRQIRREEIVARLAAKPVDQMTADELSAALSEQIARGST